MATKEREEIKSTTKQEMARRHNKEGGNHLDQDINRQKTMEDIDGGATSCSRWTKPRRKAREPPGSGKQQTEDNGRH